MRRSRHSRKAIDRVSTREEISFACEQLADSGTQLSGLKETNNFPYIPVEVLTELDDSELVFLLDLSQSDRTLIN